MDVEVTVLIDEGHDVFTTRLLLFAKIFGNKNDEGTVVLRHDSCFCYHPFSTD